MYFPLHILQVNQLFCHVTLLFTVITTYVVPHTTKVLMEKTYAVFETPAKFSSIKILFWIHEYGTF